MDQSADHRLPLSTILIYSAPTAGIGFMFIFTGFYLMKFSTDVLGISPAVMGLIFLISRLWDGINDPLAGYLSDRTRTRLGRRRPWLLAGAIPVGLVFTLMWSPPASLGPVGLGWWMGAGILFFYSAMTVFSMPHDALGAELTTSYHDRNRLFGIRRVFIGAGALPVFVAIGWLSDAPDPRAGAFLIGASAAVITTALMILTGLAIRERAEYQGRGARSPFRAVADVGHNPHGRVLLVVYFLQQIAVAAITINAAYFAQYVLGSASSVSLMLGAFFVVSIVSVPMWIGLGRRFDKRSLVLFNMGFVGLALASFGFLGEGDVLLATLIAGVAGASGGGLDVLFPSIQADVIDYDELQSGERKEGVYFAAWNLASKSAAGIAGMLVGFLLTTSGFEPNVEQTEAARRTIRVLASGFPLLCYGAGIVAFLRFGLSRSAHAEIRAQLDARR